MHTFSGTFFSLIGYSLSNEHIPDRGRIFYRAVTAFEIFPVPYFKNDLDQEIGNILPAYFTGFKVPEMRLGKKISF